mgnify:FL=1
MKHRIIIILAILISYSFSAFSETGISAKLIKSDINTTSIIDARFPGGEETLYDFLIYNIRYPYILAHTEMEGDVDVKFKIDSTGSIKDVQIIRGFDPLADDEVLRVIKEMPDWIPAESGNEAIESEQRLNIRFTLNDQLRDRKSVV